MIQFWLMGCKESFLGHIFSYMKKKQSLREGSRLPFLNATGEVCYASASVDILTSMVMRPVTKIEFSDDGGTDSNSIWFSNFTAATVELLYQVRIARLPCDSAGKESTCNEGDLGLIPGLGRSPGEGKGNLLQCSGLENSMDWIVRGVAKSRTRLSDFHFLFQPSL